MDPNAVLAAMRTCIDAYRDPNTTDRARVLYVERIIDCVQELDEWLTKGGFWPDAWTQCGRPKVGRAPRQGRAPTLSEANRPGYILSIRSPGR